MKKCFLLLVLSLFFTQLFSQNLYLQSRHDGKHEPCAMDEVHEELLQSNPLYKRTVEEINKRKRVNNNASHDFIMQAVEYTIPVVVHVVHLGEDIGVGTNISDAQIRSAIDNMNDRYGASNPGGDAGINFCLAARDPDGLPTSGINRVNGSSITGYAENGLDRDVNHLAVKSSRWPIDKYYNIWVVSEIDGNNSNGGTLGFAYFPNSGEYDGSVVIYKAFGYDPNGSLGYNLNFFSDENITLTHEMGHALSLYHTFQGDEGGETCPLDQVCGSNSDCIDDTDPHNRNDGDCGSTGQTCAGPGTNLANIVTNTMAYSSSHCQDNFSQGQIQRMRNVLAPGGARAYFASSDACSPAAPPVSDFTAPSSGCTNTPLSFLPLL